MVFVTFRREEGKIEVAYFPTHIRFSSWLIGVIGGYILFETRKTSISIPKVSTPFSLFALNLTKTLSNCMIFFYRW